MFWRLQLAFSQLARAVLAPVAAKTPLGRFKFNLGKAFAGLPRHDFVFALSDPVETGSLAVKSQTDSIKDGCFARAGRPGDGKNTAGDIIGVTEIDVPVTGQGIQVLETQAEDFHSSPKLASSCNAAIVSRNAATSSAC